MEDSQIIDLYWDRNETAIAETGKKYGSYCRAIARNILHCEEDSEECVNDTYLSTWNALPPQRPNILSAFLGKITRNLAFDRYSFNHAQKRGGGEISVVLDEIGEIVSDKDDLEQITDGKELICAINAFLAELSPERRQMFVMRYWYTDTVSTIAKQFGIADNTCSVRLSRVREQLKQYLTSRGFEL